MKRFVLIASVLFIVLGLAGTGLAQCPYFGEGVLWGNVRLSSAFPGFGQENAVVWVGGPAGGYYDPYWTLTDAGGNYALVGNLPVCFPNTGVIYGYYCVQRMDPGQPTEAYFNTQPFYFQRMNQGETRYQNINMVLTYAGVCQ